MKNRDGKNCDRQTDRRTDGRTDRQTDRRRRSDPLESPLLTAGDTKRENKYDFISNRLLNEIYRL